MNKNSSSGFFPAVPKNNKGDGTATIISAQMSPITSTLKRKEQNEKEQKRKEKQEEFRTVMSQNSEGAWKVMQNMNSKIAKIDSLVNQYQQQMEYLSSNQIQSYLLKTHSFYHSNTNEEADIDPNNQNSYGNRKKLPTSFFYIERQKIRDQIQMKTQMQFFHPEQFQKKKFDRQREDIDYLKILAKREENKSKKDQNVKKHQPVNLPLIESNRKQLLEEFVSKDMNVKAAKIAELQKKLQISEEDAQRIEQISKIHQ